MRMVVLSALQSSLILGGVLTLTLAGVRLRIDRAADEFFIQVEPEFDYEALKLISTIAESLGFEAMPEWECPPQDMDSGAIRHWLVEKEEVLNDCSLQAV